MSSTSATADGGVTSGSLGVLIAGGGVAALECALALLDLAGERVTVTLLAPEPEFVYRPLAVREPFAEPAADRYPLAEIADDIGVDLVRDGFKWLDGARRVVHTEQGAAVRYDALVLALGARRYERFPHALTLDDRRLDEQLHGLIQDVDQGLVRSVAFVVPSRVPWPLPVYELALMTAGRAGEMNVELSVTVVTPEDAPLAIFGQTVSAAVGRLLAERAVEALCSAHCEVHGAGRVSIHPGGRELTVDRVVALPELYGPATPGVPGGSRGGFLAVDGHGAVRGLERVYAAGDATDFPIKHGGIAAQQADAVAEAIAALAGAAIEPQAFHPTIRGMLLGAGKPLYMSAYVTGGHGSSSEVSEQPLWSPPTKIAARYLAPYLERWRRVTVETVP